MVEIFSATYNGDWSIVSATPANPDGIAETFSTSRKQGKKKRSNFLFQVVPKLSLTPIQPFI